MRHWSWPQSHCVRLLWPCFIDSSHCVLQYWLPACVGHVHAGWAHLLAVGLVTVALMLTSRGFVGSDGRRRLRVAYPDLRGTVLHGLELQARYG